jgi:hypothetical protein
MQMGDKVAEAIERGLANNGDKLRLLQLEYVRWEVGGVHALKEAVKVAPHCTIEFDPRPSNPWN